ncbi:hypothetical protein EF847_01530 [Actinobacteria bacterium YIM 96077]|uniref:Uncharacterized protein n=1 Tax=Phytoactinopolyspora halophila TaxID=1981511 RepID=A0A329QKV1_9ACTN|nr:hypothetical protein EF847_01530 [Actinobacteria bacterium YIM 96077]RAW11148.1 hypothetical protein DPM12_17555 [Phytoactinopolyspora halophila]
MRAALVDEGINPDMIADGLETPGWSTWPAVVTDGVVTVGVGVGGDDEDERFIVPHPRAEEPYAVENLVAYLRDSFGLRGLPEQTE